MFSICEFFVVLKRFFGNFFRKENNFPVNFAIAVITLKLEECQIYCYSNAKNGAENMNSI